MMRDVPRHHYAIFFGLAAIGTTADLLTKKWLFDWLGFPGGQTHWVVFPWFGFQTSLNEGALWGMGQGNVFWFAILSIIAAIGVLYAMLFTSAAQDRILAIALGCVMAGILGNLYDRLGLHGLTWERPIGDHAIGDHVYAVRDWILFSAGGRWNWPNFNIADSLLVCGAILLVLTGLRGECGAGCSATDRSTDGTSPDAESKSSAT